MNLSTILAGIIVAGAFLASAAMTHEQRLPALLCSAGLAASWLIFVTSWAPWSLDMMLTTYGPIEIHSIDLWAIGNCMNGVLALYVARQFWWGALLFGLLLNGCFADVLWWARLVEWGAFKQTIDIIFAGEMAVFYLVGGRGAVDMLRGFVRRVVFGSLRAARKQT